MFRVTNNTASPVFYLVVESETATRFLPPRPCDEPTVCPRVDPAEVKTIPYADMQGYGPNAAEAVFTWWHLVPGTEGGFRFDSVRSIKVKL